MHSTVSGAADRKAELLAVLEAGELDLDARVAAGEELGRLGDDRATRIDLVAIPEGPFLFGGSSAGPDGHNARAAKQVRLSAFSIDRYPVTVAAYGEFIESGGYDARALWSPAGWAWRTQERVEAPRFWGEEAWAAYLVPNHPVVGVSAYEAEAFAAWRGARLPTEAEWEKACRGVDGRCHPWGDAWRAGASGSRGIGPRGTVAIGTYPAGKSPFGLLDMVGAIWHWCADASDPEAPAASDDPWVNPADYDDGAERVTKGGGWNNLPWNVCCTGRNAYPPAARFSNVGFRCVRGGGKSM
jgi:gamma-glutamyl hercynylcysteine S-oxide synthase